MAPDGPHACVFPVPSTPNARCRRGRPRMSGSSHALLFFAGTGGLAVREGARAVLMESTIADCASVSAGGVGASPHANVTLQGSRIERCNATVYCGGIAAYFSSHVEMEGSVISECHCIGPAGPAGGFEVYAGSSTLLARNCVRAVPLKHAQAATHPCALHSPMVFRPPPPPWQRLARPPCVSCIHSWFSDLPRPSADC